MPDPPPARSGLYANLLEPTANTTSISRAPVVFAAAGASSSKDGDSAGAAAAAAAAAAGGSGQKKLNAASLRFQPTITKRPQPTKPTKPKISMKPITGAPSSTSTTNNTTNNGEPTPSTAPRPITKTTLEDWTGDDDVNGFYSSSSKQHHRSSNTTSNSKKRRKKARDTPPPPTNWDDVYDPSRPNSYEEYREGDEKVREMQDWRERVYGRRHRQRDDSWGGDSDEDDGRDGAYKAAAAGRFAPPKGYSFAPPPSLGGGGEVRSQPTPPPPPPPAEVPDDVSGEDAYARRIRMSQMGQAGYSAAAASTATPTPPPPAPSFYPPPPVQPEATISRAPVLYNHSALTPAPPTSLPPARSTSSPPPPQQPPTDDDRSTLPGQAGFAQRLMSKYGWKSGTGLGADSSGIVQPLRMVAASKSKDLIGRGKIIDRNKRANPDEGKISEVVVLESMVDGLQDEDEAVLVQEIGEECEQKYGKVERVLVHWREGRTKSRVFVVFTTPLSALKAVQALEGRLFNGNTIGAQYFDRDRFENRDFD
ncbi:hypothetical protein DFP73DRAFT_500100 [Morchella snyderi]|nr:hypothetical protein DFP73DRAFT_500100 [Morchella snyderi]